MQAPMSLWRQTLLGLILVSAVPYSFGSSITFNGPFGPGNVSNVLGDPLTFAIQSATLTQPTVVNGPWTLTVDTNYGTPLPGATEVVPSFTEGALTFAMSDFLIEQGNDFYGVVLSPHNGYRLGRYTPGPWY